MRRRPFHRSAKFNASVGLDWLDVLIHVYFKQDICINLYSCLSDW